MRRTTFFMLILSLPLGLFAQKDSLWEQFQEAEKRYQQEEYQAYQTEIHRLLNQAEGKNEDGINDSLMAVLFNALGDSYGNRGRDEQSIPYFKKAITLYSTICGEEHPDISRMLENVAAAYGRLGYLDTCLYYLNQGLEIDKKYAGLISEEVASNYNTQGIFSERLGEYEKAISYFQQSLDICQMMWGNDAQISINRMSKIAASHAQLGHYSKSLKIYTQALAFSEKYADKPSYDRADLLYRKGMLYLKIDSLEKAFQHLHESRKQFGVLKDAQRLSSVHQAIGDYHTLSQTYDSALIHYNLAIQQVAPSFTWDDLADNPSEDVSDTEKSIMDALVKKGKTLALLGTSKEDEDYLTQALSTFQLATHQIEKRRVERGVKTKQKLSAEIRNVFEHIISTSTQLYELTDDDDYKELTFEAMANSRAYALREQIYFEQINAFAGLPDSMLQQDRTLDQDLVFYQHKIKEEQAGRNDSAKLALWRGLSIDKQLKQDELLDEMAEKYPRYFALKHELPNVSFAQNLIDLAEQEACLISYFQTDSLLYVMVLSSRGSDLQALPLPPHFDKLLQRYLNELRQPGLKKDPEAAFGRFCTSSHELYQLLIEPIEKLIPLQKSLLIIPDGILGYIPFECLIEKLPSDLESVNYGSLPYLLKRFEIGYAYHTQYPETDPSVSDIRYIAFAPAFGQDAKGDSLRASLPALRYAKEEIETLENVFEGENYMLTTATESVYKQQASSYAILHLATHGWVSEGTNDHSYLLFSPDADMSEDGKLYTHELYNMNLSAKLSVLSACNTGVGKLQEGEAIMSMAHAFAYAGCPGMLMSHWQVNDQTTAELMTYFYGNIDDKQRKSQALQGAKRRFLSSADPLKSHPFYWAAMVSIGDQRPLEEESTTLYWVLGFVVVGIGFSLWKFRK